MCPPRISLLLPKTRIFCLLVGLLLLSAMLLTACDGGSSPTQTQELTEPVTLPHTATPETEAETLPSTEADTEAETSHEEVPTVLTRPAILHALVAKGLVAEQEIIGTAEGGISFHLLTLSIRALLERGGVADFAEGAYEDWYLYTVGEVCGLYYMRKAGVGISFVALPDETLLGCLDGAEGATDALQAALDGVTRSSADTRHSVQLTSYFSNPATDGAYRIAEVYLSSIAATAIDGIVPVPAHYRSCDPADGEYARVLEAVRYLEGLHPGLILWENDRPVGIRVSDPSHPANHEKQVLQAFYTMNVTLCSFASEVAVHAAGCDNWLILKYYGYNRCKIADMAVGTYNATAGMVARWENEFGFYNLDSMAVKAQEARHPEYVGEYAPAVSGS